LEFIIKENSKMVDLQRRIGRLFQQYLFSDIITLVILDRLNNECEALKKQIRELKAVINEPFDGSENELKLLITNFQRDQDKKKRELQDVSISLAFATAEFRFYYS
jgi:hypothetical protein